MELTGQLHQRCLHLQPQSLGKTDFEGFVNFADGSAQYKFIPQNTSFDGDYGNATGPDGTYTGLLLQTGESNAGLPAQKLQVIIILKQILLR
jgi:hypothetical protein